MKRVYICILVMLAITMALLCLAACNEQAEGNLSNGNENNNSTSSKNEIDVKFISDIAYSRLSDDIQGANPPYGNSISFDTFEEANSTYPSRSYCYAKFSLTFNETPKGYTAYEVYKVNNVVVDGRTHACSTRAGENYNQIEFIIGLPYYTDENSHTLQYVKYTSFDSIKGENVQHTVDVNYNFTNSTVPNYINRLSANMQFEIIEIDKPGAGFSFSIETNIEYDMLIYNVNKHGVDYMIGAYAAVFNELLYEKSDIYTLEIEDCEYYYYYQASIVGYQKDGVNYYFSPINFSISN